MGWSVDLARRTKREHLAPMTFRAYAHRMVVPAKNADRPPFNAKAIANLLLDWSAERGLAVTPLKMQKLLFFCHSDFLIETGEPLLNEEFEAWSYGPVIPGVYHEFKQFAETAIKGRAEIFDPVIRLKYQAKIDSDNPALAYLRPIFELYSPISGGLLSTMSHAKDGPWDRALKLFAANSNINRRISNELITQFHRPRPS